MAKYIVSDPEGNKYEIEAPDDATESDVLRYAEENFSKQGLPAEEFQDRNAVTLKNAGRKLALGARSTGLGLLSPVLAANDAALAAWNLFSDYTGIGRRVPTLRSGIDQGLTALGVPEAETPGEKIMSNVVEAGAAVPAWMLPISALRVAGSAVPTSRALLGALSATPLATPAAGNMAGEFMASREEQSGGSPLMANLYRFGIPTATDALVGIGKGGYRAMQAYTGQPSAHSDAVAGGILREHMTQPDVTMANIADGPYSTSYGSPQSTVLRSGDSGLQRLKQALIGTDNGMGTAQQQYVAERVRAQNNALLDAGAMNPAQVTDDLTRINKEADTALKGMANRTDYKNIDLPATKKPAIPNTPDDELRRLQRALSAKPDDEFAPRHGKVNKTINVGADLNLIDVQTAIDDLKRLQREFADPDMKKFLSDGIDLIAPKGELSRNIFDMYQARKHFYDNTVMQTKYAPKTVDNVVASKAIRAIDKAMRARLGSQWDDYLTSQSGDRRKVEAGAVLFELGTKTSGAPYIDPATNQPVKPLSAAAWDASLKKGSFAEKAWTVLDDTQKKTVMEIYDDLQRGAAEQFGGKSGGSDTVDKLSVAAKVGQQVAKAGMARGVRTTAIPISFLLGDVLDNVYQGSQQGIRARLVEGLQSPEVAKILLQRYDASKHQKFVQKFAAQLATASDRQQK